MKDGIELFEDTNQKLELLERNHEKLKRTLEDLLKTLTLKGEYLRHMNEPDFEHDLPEILKGARQLHKAMQTTMDGGLEKLKAVKEVRKSNEELKERFCSHVVRFMESKFQEVSRNLPEKVGVEPGDRDSFPRILPDKGCLHHEVLRRYLELMKTLERLDFPKYRSLRHKYVVTFSRVHELTLQDFFAHIRQRVIVEDKRSVFQNFPDYILNADRNITRRGHRGALRRGPSAHRRPDGGSNMGTEISSTSVAVALSGKKLVTQIFGDCLHQTIPLVMKEQEFCVEFFGKHANLDFSLRSESSDSLMAHDDEKEMESSTTRGSSGDRHSAAHTTTVDNSDTESLSEIEHKGAGGQNNKNSDGRRGSEEVASSIFGSTSVTHRSRGGGSRTTINPEVIKNQQDMVEILTGLFAPLEPEMRDIGAWGDNMDHFYSLNMLVDTEIVQNRYFGKSMYVVEMMGNVQRYLRLLFNVFIDEAVNWITNFKVASKRCGVISPFLKFPSFVERIESVVRDLKSGAADTTYTKLLYSLFKTLEGVAKQDSKYTDVVLMENYHHFWRIFYNRRDPIPSALVQAVEKAAEEYWKHLDLYVQWNVRYELAGLTKFWDKVDAQLETVTPGTFEILCCQLWCVAGRVGVAILSRSCVLVCFFFGP